MVLTPIPIPRDVPEDDPTSKQDAVIDPDQPPTQEMLPRKVKGKSPASPQRSDADETSTPRPR
jgi:hypothetical protein